MPCIEMVVQSASGIITGNSVEIWKQDAIDFILGSWDCLESQLYEGRKEP